MYDIGFLLISSMPIILLISNIADIDVYNYFKFSLTYLLELNKNNKVIL